MEKIICTKKSGFKPLVDGDIFYIYDYRGVIFYTNKDLKKNIKAFNLPEGVYFSTSKFIRLKNPIKNKKIILPIKERDLKINQFKIEFKENKNKATVYYNDGLIIFDLYFKKCPLPDLFFTYFHELGHRFFQTEKYCDLYAAKKMYAMGFNTSQIGKSPVKVLSDRAHARKVFLVDKLMGG